MIPESRPDFDPAGGYRLFETIMLRQKQRRAYTIRPAGLQAPAAWGLACKPGAEKLQRLRPYSRGDAHFGKRSFGAKVLEAKFAFAISPTREVVP